MLDEEHKAIFRDLIGAVQEVSHGKHIGTPGSALPRGLEAVTMALTGEGIPTEERNIAASLNRIAAALNNVADAIHEVAARP